MQTLYVIWKYYALTTKKALSSWNHPCGIVSISVMASACTGAELIRFLIEQYSINAITQVMPILLRTHKTLFILRVDALLSPKGKGCTSLLPVKEGREGPHNCVSQLLPVWERNQECGFWDIKSRKEEELPPSFSSNFLPFLYHLSSSQNTWVNIKKHESRLYPITCFFF